MWRADQPHKPKPGHKPGLSCGRRRLGGKQGRRPDPAGKEATTDSEEARTPIEYRDGFLPLEDYGLIGDGATAALVGRNGRIAWMCLPRFDSAPVFCGLLGPTGGGYTLAPERAIGARQYYERDTAVLVTELQGSEGVLEVTDACLLQSGADLTQDEPLDKGVLLRSFRVLRGRVRVVHALEPYGGASCSTRADGLRVRPHDRPDLDLQLQASLPLSGLRTTWQLEEGTQAHVTLGWKARHFHHRAATPPAQLQATRSAWRAWVRHIQYAGPRAELVRRSAITLKLLDYFDNGALVAAPTSSLPEWIGGARNWDYRYAWVRDAAFCVHALQKIGLGYEAQGFLGWVLDAEEVGGRPHVLYTLDGNTPGSEEEDPHLLGYRGSRPVRWGNAAAHQQQHDVFGEVMDCAYQWVRRGGSIGEALWRHLVTLAEAANQEWNQPDHGIWEARTAGCPYTYSAALCQVALDRAARISTQAGLQGPRDRWRARAKRIRDAVLQQAWCPRQEALTACLDGGGLDASLLALPLRRVVDACHPRMIATTAAIARELSAGHGLLFRYHPEKQPDGLPGREGAFLLCSFWHVENLVMQGEVQQAHDLFDSLCSRAGPQGLLPEQIEPSSGLYLGNYPQAMSHVGLIASAVRLEAANQ